MCSVFLGRSGEVPEVLGNLDKGVCVVCSVFLGPSREVPEVLGNPGILGQGGVCSVQCLPGTTPGSNRGTRESRDTWTRGCM